MLCQDCKEREATTHVKRVINGQLEEYHLCQECAQKYGYGNLFSNMTSLDNFLGNFFMGSAANSPHLPSAYPTCKKCGSSFNDIAKTGKVGCADCYTTFYDSLLPSLQRIHGKARHVGRISSSAGPEAKRKAKINSLKVDLNKCISDQNYEKAAKLRDEIKELEKEGEQNDGQ